MKVTFPKSLTIDACEKIITKLAEADVVEDLVLPIDTAKFAFGGLATAIQSVITWGRKSANRKLVIKSNERTVNDQVAEVIIRPHQFTASMFAKEITSDNSSEPDNLKRDVFGGASQAIDIQAKSKFGQQRGALCWFAFVDHSTKGFDRNFYIENSDSKAQPRNQDQITSIIRSMVEKSLSTAGGGKRLDDEDVIHLGRMFWELFLNTHEHGSRGKNRQEWLKPGVRIIYSNAVNSNGRGNDSSWGKAPALSDYLVSQGASSRFVEISIIDSGLGFCGRWQADKSDESLLSLSDEYEKFRTCFTFRQTSSGENHKGNGLPVVMERLTKLKGLMRIRSGRLALFRNFVKEPYNQNDNCTFTDWLSCSPADQGASEMPFVSGVAITLLIPLEAKQ